MPPSSHVRHPLVRELDGIVVVHDHHPFVHALDQSPKPRLALAQRFFVLAAADVLGVEDRADDAETLTSTGSPVRVNHTSWMRNESTESRARASQTAAIGFPTNSSSA
jgi:hypothetical protein